jgi:hypothetical protein
MDTEAAATPRKPKTLLKIPFSGVTLQATPFEARHATGLAMSKHIKSEMGKLNAFLFLLSQLLTEDSYQAAYEAVVGRDGEATPKAVLSLLTDIVQATNAYNKAQDPDQAEPASGE